jgi:transketolase
MASDQRVLCVDTDTGLFADTDFGPAAGQYIKLGIAEHVLMGAAAAMAADGRIPFVNTMATFAASRAAEAVKIDIAYNGLPVRIAATHSGLSAGHLGPTHHGLEDIAIMRTLPQMTVVVPGDAAQTEALVEQSMQLPGPLYLRLGRKATPPLPPTAPPTELGRVQTLRRGGDVAVLACGPLPIRAALAAAEDVAADGIEATVANVHTIKPLDTSGLLDVVGDATLVVTVEDHWRTGGLGGAIAEALAETTPRPLVRVGIPDTFAGLAGDHEYLLDHYGVSAEAVAAQIRKTFGLIPLEV